MKKTYRNNDKKNSRDKSSRRFWTEKFHRQMRRCPVDIDVIEVKVPMMAFGSFALENLSATKMTTPIIISNLNDDYFVNTKREWTN